MPATRTKSKPPILLQDCRIEQFALLGSIRFTGHGLLFHDGKEVGPVPRLALGRDLNNDILLLHCDARWRVLGLSVYPNIRAAKKRADRFYPGISRLWRRTGYTRAQAHRQRKRSGADRRCAICEKPWWRVDAIVEIQKRQLAFCVDCIRELNALAEGPDHPSVT